MWTESTMPVGESMIVSALGLSVVFATLVVLALAIILISKIIRGIIKDGAAAPAAAAPAVSGKEELDKETFAILMAVISEELSLPMEQFRILSIKEV